MASLSSVVLPSFKDCSSFSTIFVALEGFSGRDVRRGVEGAMGSCPDSTSADTVFDPLLPRGEFFPTLLYVIMLLLSSCKATDMRGLPLPVNPLDGPEAMNALSPCGSGDVGPEDVSGGERIRDAGFWIDLIFGLGVDPDPINHPLPGVMNGDGIRECD